MYSYFDTICFVFEYPTLSMHNFIIRSIGKFFSKLLLINKSINDMKNSKVILFALNILIILTTFNVYSLELCTPSDEYKE